MFEREAKRKPLSFQDTPISRNIHGVHKMGELFEREGPFDTFPMASLGGSRLTFSCFPADFHLEREAPHFKRNFPFLGPPVVPFYTFLGEGSPTNIDYRKRGTHILTPYWRTYFFWAHILGSSYLPHSFQGSFFLENLRKPRETDPVFKKRAMVEKKGNQHLDPCQLAEFSGRHLLSFAPQSSGGGGGK